MSSGDPALSTRSKIVKAAVEMVSHDVLSLSVDQLRSVFDQDPELRDVVLRAYLVRHAIGFELSIDLRILGRPDVADPTPARRRHRSRAHRGCRRGRRRHRQRATWPVFSGTWRR